MARFESPRILQKRFWRMKTQAVEVRWLWWTLQFNSIIFSYITLIELFEFLHEILEKRSHRHVHSLFARKREAVGRVGTPTPLRIWKSYHKLEIPNHVTQRDMRNPKTATDQDHAAMFHSYAYNRTKQKTF